MCQKNNCVKASGEVFKQFIRMATALFAKYSRKTAMRGTAAGGRSQCKKNCMLHLQFNTRYGIIFGIYNV